MRARTLPPAEWPRLVGTEAEQLWPRLDPTAARIVVVEDAAGAIVACTVLLAVLHADCVWIHPAHQRRAGVARCLWRAVEDTSAELGARCLAVVAVVDVMRRFFARVGATRLEGDSYVWALKPRSSSAA